MTSETERGLALAANILANKLANEEQQVLEDGMLTLRFPARSTRCDCGCTRGIWQIWCIVDARWYSGKASTLHEANQIMLDNLAQGKHLGIIKQEHARHKPDAKTRSEPRADVKLSEMF